MHKRCTISRILVYSFVASMLVSTSKCQIFSNVLDVIPTPVSFLATILNVTNHKEATEMADSFDLSEKNVYSDNITILFYRDDGYFTVRRLYHSKKGPLKHQEEIKIIIHGFNSYGTIDWTKQIAMAYHKIGFKNTLVVDWRGIANLGYFEAASSTKYLGIHVGQWIYYKLLSGNPDHVGNVHCIGHSLGAHICGFIGKRISELTKNQYRIGKISALDPAAPLFEYPIPVEPSKRLYKTDALDLEVYHSNVGFFGYQYEIGHQDFYISNGGPIQPGCHKGIQILDTLVCSHQKAYRVFIKAITSTDYVATQCNNRFFMLALLCKNNKKVIMGENGNSSDVYGTFYVNVDSDDNPE